MLCPNCNTERDVKDFKRYATLTQTRSWLKNPNAKTRLLYTGKVCNACHKQTVRKPSEISPEELRKRMVSQGINPDLVEHLHAQRVKAGKKRQSEGGLRAIKKRREPLFKPVLDEIATIMRWVRDQQRYIKRTEIRDFNPEPRPYPHRMHEHPELNYLGLCEASLIVVRDKVHTLRKMGSVPPKRWHELIPEKLFRERVLAHDLMRGKYKDRLARVEESLSGVREGAVEK